MPIYQDRAGKVRMLIYEEQDTGAYKKVYFREDLDPYFTTEDVLDAKHLAEKADRISWQLSRRID